MLNGMFSGNNKDRNRPTPKPFSQTTCFDSKWGKASPVEKAPPRALESSTASRRAAGAAGAGNGNGNATASASVTTGEHPIALDPREITEKLKETLNADGTHRHQQVITKLSPRDILIVTYELLKAYGLEYNTAVGVGPFYLEMTKPHEVSGPLRLMNMAPEWVTRVRAAIATSTHAMLLCADDRALAFYVVALDQLHCNGPLGKDALQDQVPETYLQLNTRGETGYWETKAGLPLTMSRVDATCRALFQWLIERTADRVAGD